jgi:hypothetical protein
MQHHASQPLQLGLLGRRRGRRSGRKGQEEFALALDQVLSGDYSFKFFQEIEMF